MSPLSARRTRTGPLPSAIPTKKELLNNVPGEVGQLPPGPRDGKWSGRDRSDSGPPSVVGARL
jgi:hypothetical protein